MRKLFFRGGKTRLLGTLTAGTAFFLASCGTIIHPERRGQPAGHLDPSIVILDGLGLLLFFVPGVIAFVVDFSTGAIYLPPGHANAPSAEGDLHALKVDPATLTPTRLESIVHEQTGRQVSLRNGSYQARKLNALDDFNSATLEKMKTDPAPARVVFRANDP